MKRNKINFQLSDMKLDELWLKTRRGVLYALYLIGALLVQNVDIEPRCALRRASHVSARARRGGGAL